jgi:DNA-binding Lrp family transcriptional regulator
LADNSSVTLDDLDRAILAELQMDARATLQDVARAVGLSAPGLQKRLSKLEDAGVIHGYRTIVSRESLGFDLMCLVSVNLLKHDLQAVHGFRQAVREMPQVLECFHVTGESDYVLKVVARNRRDLEHFLIEVLTPAPGVDRIRTSLVLNEIKESTVLPIQPETYEFETVK